MHGGPYMGLVRVPRPSHRPHHSCTHQDGSPATAADIRPTLPHTSCRLLLLHESVPNCLPSWARTRTIVEASAGAALFTVRCDAMPAIAHWLVYKHALTQAAPSFLTNPFLSA